jgi:hypothetical protein
VLVSEMVDVLSAALAAGAAERRGDFLRGAHGASTSPAINSRCSRRSS